jgi:hypothetical protein
VSGIPGPLQHRPGKSLQPLHARRHTLQGLEDRQPPGCLILQQRNQELFLAPEVAVEAALAHPSLFADLVDGELAERLPTSASPGCLDDVAAPLLLLLRSQHGHGPNRLFEMMKLTDQFYKTTGAGARMTLTMRLELDDGDLEILREVLHSVVQDLSSEIADTDNPTYRRDLKSRRDRLRAVLDRLEGPPEA